MATELQIMGEYFVNKLKGDTAFKAAFGETDIHSRIGRPIARQGAAYPVVNIRDLGPANGGVLRIKNSGPDKVWVQRLFLVVAVNESAIYPSNLAAIMEGLFKLNVQLAVTGGTIFHCYLADPQGPHSDTYTPASGKTYAEEGAFWVVAAKAS